MDSRVKLACKDYRDLILNPFSSLVFTVQHMLSFKFIIDFWMIFSQVRYRGYRLETINVLSHVQ